MRLAEAQSSALSRAPRWTAGEEFVNTLRPLTLHQFVEHHRLRLKRDVCGDHIIPGKFGHLYEHGAGLAGLVLEDTRNGQSTARSILPRRRKALAAGFRLHRAGDGEAILLFEMSNPAQDKLAIRLVGAKSRRIPSPAQLETLRRAPEAPRIGKNPAQRPLQDVGTNDFPSKGDDPDQSASPSGSAPI